MPDFSPCHSCDRRQRPPKNGKAACLADPERRDIRVMVTVGCPHPSGPRFTPEAGPTEAGRQRLVPIEAPPLPRGEWPRVVKLIARRALPGERGVGDTLARLFDAPKFKGRGAGELFKAYTKKHGIDCGCGQRQDWLNARYPY